MPEQSGTVGYSRRREPREEELATWRAFLRAHAVVTRRIERELVGAGGLSLSEFDVLVTLGQAPEASLRPGDLAERVVLTKSGMTRLLDRLEASGLLERRVCEHDRRGQYARLTTAGRTALRRATRPHLRGVARGFSAPVGAASRPAFRRTLERIAAAS